MFTIAIPPTTPSEDRIPVLMRAQANMVAWGYGPDDTLFIGPGNLTCMTNILNGFDVNVKWHDTPDVLAAWLNDLTDPIPDPRRHP